MIIETRILTRHELNMENEYKNLYPEKSKATSYLEDYYRKYNEPARKKAKAGNITKMDQADLNELDEEIEY